MATFVLVHGAWSGGWTWKEIARKLARAGHDAYRPTLTGVGERSHLLRAGIDLDTHIADVLNLIKYEQLDHIVLCGHSYGGMVVTGVADAVPDKIASLVYLDAFVPKDGQSLRDLTPPGRNPPEEGISVPPLSPSAFGLSPEKAAIVAERRSPQPAATLSQKIKLTGGIDRIKKRSFIYANNPAPTSFTRFYDAFSNDPSWKTYTLPCTHMVQLEMPNELTEILLASIP